MRHPKPLLTEEHAEYFSYQILRELLYLLRANVVHRARKPSNILVNVCNFGRSRAGSETEDGPTLTDYVVPRCYQGIDI